MNIRKCKHCGQEFDISDKSKGWMANHSRWCDSNPKKKTYQKNLAKARKTIKAVGENQFTKAKREGREIESKLKGRPGQSRPHTEETKQKIKEKALASKHRRLRKGVIEYKGILLDSSWELELAKRLDELKIKWIRPEPIPWIDGEGIVHNYFPDFYLEDYDLYLDPKNPQAVKVQKKKLDVLLNQYDNIVIIESLEDCKQFNL
jgi:hypothetical protein